MPRHTRLTTVLLALLVPLSAGAQGPPPFAQPVAPNMPGVGHPGRGRFGQPPAPTVVVPAQPWRPAQPTRPPVFVPPPPARPAQPAPPFAQPAVPGWHPGQGYAPPAWRTQLPPPAMPREMRPPPPAAGHTWIPGYYSWNQGQYVWSPGYWYRAPSPHARWIAPRWEFRAGVWIFVQGYWVGPGGVMLQLPPPTYAYPTPVVPIEPTPVYAQPIVLGRMVQGVLQTGDMRTASGAFADDYALNLVAGQTATIVTRGGPSASRPGLALDVYTIVLSNGQELTHDDDSAGYPNSRIVFTAPFSGTFVVRVTTYGAGANQGTYNLQTFHGALPWQN